MLNFRNTNIVFALLLLMLVAIDTCYDLPFFFYFLPAAAYLLLLFYGSYSIGSGFYMPVTCRARTTAKKIAISFDDGPAAGIRSILQILDQHKIKAAFFCIGKNIEADHEMLREMYDAGHIVGNHSYSHNIAFDFMNTKKVKADLQKTHSLVKRITGRDMRWFRPPFGVTNPNIAKAARRMSYTTIGWSIRSLDTVTKDKTLLLERVKKQLHPGAVILFHDTCAVTAAVLPSFIQYAREEGYEIMPMDKLLNLQPYAD